MPIKRINALRAQSSRMLPLADYRRFCSKNTLGSILRDRHSKSAGEVQGRKTNRREPIDVVFIRAELARPGTRVRNPLGGDIFFFYAHGCVGVRRRIMARTAENYCLIHMRTSADSIWPGGRSIDSHENLLPILLSWFAETQVRLEPRVNCLKSE